MTAKTQPLYKSRIDLPEADRIKTVDILNKTLATTLDLKTQVKQAHWNVKGWDFYQLHLLFDEISGEIEEYTDMVAERITTLGGYANGTARAAAQNSVLPEYPSEAIGSVEHLNALAERLAQYAKLVRDGIAKTAELGDATTSDLYTEISRTVDKRLWFIEAHLQGN
jgi:starvation-inducible DNA-binding protein